MADNLSPEVLQWLQQQAASGNFNPTDAQGHHYYGDVNGASMGGEAGYDNGPGQVANWTTYDGDGTAKEGNIGHIYGADGSYKNDEQYHGGNLLSELAPIAAVLAMPFAATALGLGTGGAAAGVGGAGGGLGAEWAGTLAEGGMGGLTVPEVAAAGIPTAGAAGAGYGLGPEWADTLAEGGQGVGGYSGIPAEAAGAGTGAGNYTPFEEGFDPSEVLTNPNPGVPAGYIPDGAIDYGPFPNGTLDGKVGGLPTDVPTTPGSTPGVKVPTTVPPGGGGGGGGNPSTGGDFDWSNLLKLIPGLLDYNSQNKASDTMQNWLNAQQSRIDNSYKQGSPEFNAMWDEMSRKDAAAGRNSQYGARAVDLAGRLTQIKGDQSVKLASSLGNVWANSINQKASAGAGLSGLVGNLLSGAANSPNASQYSGLINQIGSWMNSNGYAPQNFGNGTPTGGTAYDNFYQGNGSNNPADPNSDQDAPEPGFNYDF